MCSNQIEINIHTFANRTTQKPNDKLSLTDLEQSWIWNWWRAAHFFNRNSEEKTPTTNCHKIRYCQPSIPSHVTLPSSFRFWVSHCVSHSHHKVAWWCSVTIEEQILLPCAYLIELSSECKLLLCRKSGSMGQAAQQRRFNGGGCVELLLPKVSPQALLGGSLVQRENITNLIIQFFTWQFYIRYIDLGRNFNSRREGPSELLFVPSRGNFSNRGMYGADGCTRIN